MNYQKHQQHNTLRVRTLEILWHWKEERDEEIKVDLQDNLIDGVTSIDYNTHNDRILTTGGDKRIRMWQLHPAAIDTWLDNSAADMTACCTHLCTAMKNEMPLTARWSPQGELFASGHCNGYVYLWHKKKYVDSAESIEEWDEVTQMRGHVYDVYDVCFSPCSRFVLSGSWEGGVMVHHLEKSVAIVHLPQSHGKFCRGVAWDPWNRFFVSFGASPALQLYTINIPLPKKDNEFNTNEVMTTKATAAKATSENVNYLEKEEHMEEEQLSTWEHRHKEIHQEHGCHAHRLKRLHVLKQEVCDGDYLGESCAIAFRRLAFSPDGLLLAVPFGKVPRTARLHNDDNDVQHTLNSANSVSMHAEHHTATGRNEICNNKNKSNNKSNTREKVKCNVDADDLAHCVNIYARHAPKKLMCRLAIRGYNEIRGVQWAPCFFAPIHVVESNEESAGDAHGKDAKADNHDNTTTTTTAAGNGGGGGDNDFPSECFKTNNVTECKNQNENNITPTAQSSNVQERKQSVQDTIESRSLHQECLEKEHEQEEEVHDELKSGDPNVNNVEDIHAKKISTIEKEETEYQRHLSEMWGPAEYRMALAVWTSDAVIVYTTDSTKRHSDYTDLHMRSIMDLTWSGDGAYLYTASLDGYVSVISFGDSLCPSSRLPIFAQTSPLCRIVHDILTRIDELSKMTEFKYSDQNNGNDNEKGKNNDKERVTMVAVRKKKKKVDQSRETTFTAADTTTETNLTVTTAVPKHAEVTEMELRQLEELMSDVETTRVINVEEPEEKKEAR